jgi:YegS/Rv2252/BmrU family lipid kinase
MPVAVIVNPISGTRGRRRHHGPRRVELASRLLDQVGLRGSVSVTQGPGQAAAHARRALACGATAVVAWGGDGTVNEVASALAFGGVPLGIVPAGSGNGLARDLGLPARPLDALRVALEGREVTIDAGELDGRLFFNLAGIGFDARMAACFDARGPHRRGVLRYAAIALRELARYRPLDHALRVDGDALHARALLVACANARQYGGRALIAPRARPDDGLLDLVVVEARSPLAVLWQARRLFTGTLAAAPRVHMRPFRQLEVTGPAPVAAHVDGEPVSAGARLGVRVRPGALRVRIPRR